MNRPLRTIPAARAAVPLHPLAAAILAAARTDEALTGPTLAERIGVPCDAAFRGVLRSLLRTGRLHRRYGRRRYPRRPAS